MIYETRCSTNKISELEKITKYNLIFYTNAELHAKTLSYPISIFVDVLLDSEGFLLYSKKNITNFV